MKKASVMVIVVMRVALCTVCSCTKKKGNEVEKSTDEIIYRQSELDWSNIEKDISKIGDTEITEARIIWGDKIYRTTDEAVLSEIKNLISKMQLVEADEALKEEITNTDSLIVGEEYNLYLLDDDSIMYSFKVENNKHALYVSGELYEPNNDFTTVLNYCRKEFWY